MKLVDPMLLVFDGLDNCGKTTQIYRLAEYLKHENKITIFTPSASVRRYIEEIQFEDLSDFTLPIKSYNYALSGHAFSLAYIHNKLIKNLLYNRTTVLMDRWLYSAFMYNCITEDLRNLCNTIYKDTLGDLIDVNFFIDTKIETCISRSKNEQKDNVSFLSTKENLIQVLKNHNETYNQQFDIRNKLVNIDGNRSEEVIFEDILQVIKQINEKRK